MKFFKKMGIILALGLAMLILVSAVLFSPQYMFRILRYGESDVNDRQIFPERPIKRSDYPYGYARGIKDSLDLVKLSGREQTLGSFLEGTDTTAFLIIQGDVLVYEYYPDGLDASSWQTSFSSAKSMLSLLVGIAIDEGRIGSVNDPLFLYVPEFKGTGFESVTIRELLRMRSKIDYREGMLWFGDDARTYYDPDLRRLALEEMSVDADYDGRFHYNNYHPLLLGLILERATGMPVSDYFASRVWQKIGAQYPASWSLDSEESGFEKMESGLNFRAIDFAKVGSMVLHGGSFHGERVVSSSWLLESLVPKEEYQAADYAGSFLEGRNTGYQYLWYSVLDEGEEAKEADVFAAGKYGQFLYVSRKNDVVMVRTGSSAGGVDWWPDLLHELAELVAEH